VDDKTPLAAPDWEQLIETIANEIIEERTPARILQVRAKLYDLLTHCIPASTILKTLTFQLVRKVEPALKSEIVTWSAFYEHRIRLGSVCALRNHNMTLLTPSRKSSSTSRHLSPRLCD